MIKTRTQILEEIYDKTIAVIVDSEIQIEYLKKQDPKLVLLQEKVAMAGAGMKKDWTVEMLIKKEESKLKENNEVLSIIDKRIKEEVEGSKVVEKP